MSASIKQKKKSGFVKSALVTGAGGFIGHHLVAYLIAKGYWVRGVDKKTPEFSKTVAHEFLKLDLREEKNCLKALSRPGGFDEVYHLAAEMGGLGFIHGAPCQIMHDSALIDVHMIQSAVAQNARRYFFSSSVCIYRNMRPGDPMLSEKDAYPAFPDNEYGWEKLYAERIALAFAKCNPLQVRIARFENCYGPEGAWRGGREKAPAAICRKVAMARDGGEIEVWGDGKAVRSFIYIEDMVDGIYHLMQSDLEGPVNIGNGEYVTVNQLVATVAHVAGKTIRIKHVDGPVGVYARNFSNERIGSTGWRPKFTLKDGIARTYPWVAKKVKNQA